MKGVLQTPHAKCEHLTGLPSNGVANLLKLCTLAGVDKLFKPAAHRFLISHQGARPRTAAGEPSSQSTLPVPIASKGFEDLLLMLLMYLKWDISEAMLSFLFNVDQSHVSVRLASVASILEDILRNTVGKKRTVPETERLRCFGPDTPFKDVTQIADTTLLHTDKPRHHYLQHLMWSTYMPGHKLKAFVSMGPDGHPSFVSKLYPSSYSDRDIAKHSGFLDFLCAGEVVMFDKGGSNLLPDLAERHVRLITPHFVCNGYLQPGEIKFSRLVALARVHIERLNERCKRFRWLNGVLLTSGYDSMDAKWHVCLAYQFHASALQGWRLWVGTPESCGPGRCGRRNCQLSCISCRGRI